MREKHVRQCPMLTTDGVIDSLFYIDTFSERIRYSNPVILMAGGLGTRLAPLTNDCPKPLLKVGGKPIVEIILESFVEQGFEQFFISINYRAQMVKQYLGDGSTWNVHIHYLEEDNKLGTAGGLKLLPERPACPFIVMNADLLTKVNFGNLIHYHSEQKSIGTMGVREYDFQVPYGVVNVDEYKITKIVEKPLHRFFVNAGIYCLDPPSLDFIPHASYFDMPNLLQALLAAGKQLSCFPIREYWIDIGQLRDFQRANEEYAEQFLYVTRKK
jgi:NDP-sugar pyrophosphorylase family protein